MERIALLLENNKTTVVPINDVIYFESDGNYTLVKTQGNDKKMVTAKILKEIEDKMNPEYFFRISKQYLINLMNMKEYKNSIPIIVVMSDGSELTVARRRVKAFREKIKEICLHL